MEEHTELRDSLAQCLVRHGHEVGAVGSGRDALAAYRGSDLVLLDLELSDIDGLQVCREIRNDSDVPVIAVAERDSELDRVLGLQAGADDYVIKPYGMRELVARMEAILRRVEFRPQSPRVVTRGPLTIDSAARRAEVNGKPLNLTRKEFELLHLLACNPGRVVSRENIILRVWGDSWSRRTLDTHISSLRGKLGGSHWIVTVRGVGFRMGGPEVLVRV